MKHKLLTLLTLTTLSLTSQAAIQNGKAYGNWQGVCENNQCGVVQTQNNSQGEPVGQILISKTPDNSIIAQFTLPLGVNLLAGIGLAVDHSQIGVTPYIFCDPTGCHSILPLDLDTQNKLKAGKSLQVAAFLGESQQTLDFSLIGATDALNNL